MLEKTRHHLRRRYPRSAAFVAARLAPGEYLGLHLTIGLLVTLIAVVVFAAITEDVVHQDPLTLFDLAVAARLHERATPTGTAIFHAVSAVGAPETIAAFGVLVSILLLVRGRWLLLGGWVAALLGGALLNSALKLAIRRPRPIYAIEYLHDGGMTGSFSFPSGHTMGSIVGYGMLAYLLVLGTRRPGERIGIVIGAAILVAAIGFSRLYLGAHYVSDVAGALAAGAAWLAVCISGVDTARRRKRRQIGGPAP